MTKRRKAATTKEPRAANTVKSPDSPLCLALSHVDLLLDRIRLNKIKVFDEANIASLRFLVQAEIKSLNVRYEHTLNDLKEALAGDAFFLEAYSHFTKPQLKLANEYLKKMKSLKHDDAQGKIRKKTERKKKVKPPAVIVRSLLYLPKDVETGVQSADPTTLVGAQQMWVYNAKTRRLGCYYAKHESGLSAKGTTIIDYDEEKSTFKTLRKPKEQLWKFISSGVKFWDAIKSVPQKMGKQTTRDTLIVKVA